MKIKVGKYYRFRDKAGNGDYSIKSNAPMFMCHRIDAAGMGWSNDVLWCGISGSPEVEDDFGPGVCFGTTKDVEEVNPDTGEAVGDERH